MNEHTATPSTPEMAGCSGSLRTSRKIAIPTATPIADQIAGISEVKELTSTKTTIGTAE